MFLDTLFVELNLYFNMNDIRLIIFSMNRILHYTFIFKLKTTHSFFIFRFFDDLFLLATQSYLKVPLGFLVLDNLNVNLKFLLVLFINLLYAHHYSLTLFLNCNFNP